jgi:hypothetical protein
VSRRVGDEARKGMRSWKLRGLLPLDVLLDDHLLEVCLVVLVSLEEDSRLLLRLSNVSRPSNEVYERSH